MRAANRAERLFANEQAVRYLTQALEVAPSPEARPPLLLRQAVLQDRQGALAEAEAVFRQVLAAIPEDVRAAVGLGNTLSRLGRYDEALEAVRNARSRPSLSPDEFATIAGEEGRLLAYSDAAAAVEVLESAGAAISGRGTVQEAEILIHLSRTEQLIQRKAEACGHADRARELLEAAGDLPRLATALRVLGGALDELDPDGDEAVPTLERGLAVARQVGYAEEIGACLINLSRVHGRRGRLDEAIADVEEAIAALGSIGIKGGVAAGYANLAEYLGDAGRWAESIDAARRALAVAEEIKHPMWITGALNGISAAELHLGRPDAAAAAAESAIVVAENAGLTSRVRSGLENAASAYEALGRDDRAQDLRERAERIL